ncbi:MAG: outer membrane beta-barrel protein [Bacteroidales bacterium]|nr:outer membrane beta-barrel protein [Bacteroidales bacterium]MBK8882752.1 outer membrane beta-barrel protein [Bacteroidales bacterium]
MRTYRVFLTFLFAFFLINLNAQFFVGGNIGFSAATHKNDDGITTSKATTNSFSFNPSVGKFLSDKVALGLDLNLTFNGGTTGTNPEIKVKSSSVGASPFLRYYAITWNKFSVFGQANLGFAITNSSETINGTKTDGPKVSSYYFTIYPGLSYDVSDKLQLQTYINIFRLGYGYNTEDDGSTKVTSSNFVLGAGLDDIISVPTISVGAIYKF